MLAGEQGTITRSVAVSQPSNDSEGSELRKIQSLHVRGSETLPLLPQLPAAATMEGSRSPAVAISSISHNASSSSSLYSLTSPRSPSSPKSSKTVRNGRAARLKLKVSSSPTFLQTHQDRQLPSSIQILPDPIHIYIDITLHTCLALFLSITVIKLYARIAVKLWRRILQQSR